MTAAELDEICRAVFPIRATNERASLEYVEPGSSEQWLRAVVRLIVWDLDEATGVMSIRDVKEQEVGLLAVDDPTTVERMRVYMNALARVLAKALSYDEVECLMPHDLLGTNALKLKNARTEDDFVKALSVKSRLGRWMPRPAPRPVTAPELDAMFAATFPIVPSGDGATLHYVAICEKHGALCAMLRMHGKQQPVAIVPVATAVRIDRVEAFVKALGRVLPRVLASASNGSLTPPDLVNPSVLQLETAQTEDDFVKALSAKSRLGRLLG